MTPRAWWNRLPQRRRATLLAAAALLVVGVALFFLAGGLIWLKVFGGFLAGTGGARLVLAARPPARAGREPAS